MKVLFSFFILFHFCIYCNAQSITRKIVDSQTGLPLSYATIKVLHVPKGVIASDKGEFTLQINPDDSVLFSYIGYQEKILKGNNIGDAIYLVRKVRTLREITIREKKLLNTLLLGNNDESLTADINWGPSNGGKDEFAQRIDVPDSSHYYRIKKICVPIKKHVCVGAILLHIYSMDSTSEFPGEELLLKRIDLSKKDLHDNKVIIDISAENLLISNSKYFFVSIGWPDEAFMKKCITTILLSKLSKEKTYTRTLNSNTYNWFPFGKWKDKIMGNPYEIRTFYSVQVDEMK